MFWIMQTSFSTTKSARERRIITWSKFSWMSKKKICKKKKDFYFCWAAKHQILGEKTAIPYGNFTDGNLQQHRGTRKGGCWASSRECYDRSLKKYNKKVSVVFSVAFCLRGVIKGAEQKNWRLGIFSHSKESKLKNNVL